MGIGKKKKGFEVIHCRKEESQGKRPSLEL
jgi:hypothetical protein